MIDWPGILSIISTFLLIVFFLIYSKKNSEKKLWVIFFYLICSLLNDLNDISTRIEVPSIYYTIIEFSLVSTFFLLTLKKRTFRTILRISYPFFLAIAIVHYLVTPGNSFDSLPTTVESILIIVFSILFFYEKLSDLEVIFIYDTKDFWIVAAFLLSFSATLFLYNFIEGLSTEEANKVWFISAFSNILKNVLLAIAFSRNLK